MKIKKFFDDIEKGLKGPVHLIVSKDHYLLSEAARAVKASIPQADREFGFNVFDMDSPEGRIPFDKISDVLYTIPFMGGRQVVIVENLNKLTVDEIKPVGRYIASPVRESLLVLLYLGEIKKTHAEHIEGAKPVVLDIKEADFPAWVELKAADHKIAISKDAINFLIELIGHDPGVLAAEVDKLAMTGKKKVELADVEEMSKGYGDFNAFDMVNALASRDAERAIRIYRAIAQLEEPQNILGALNWHYSKRGGKPEAFSLLHEADKLIKSGPGDSYPFEYLIYRLTRIS